MTGTVGKLIKEMENKIFPTKTEGKAFMDQWLKDKDIRKCVYQGSASFEGNQAEKLLMNVDPSMTNAYRQMGVDIFEKAQPFIITLLWFRKVVICCFG